MKRFFKVTSAIAVAASLLVLCTSQAFAVSEGQIAGGNVNYKIKDLTQNSVYANPAALILVMHWNIKHCFITLVHLRYTT